LRIEGEKGLSVLLNKEADRFHSHSPLRWIYT